MPTNSPTWEYKMISVEAKGWLGDKLDFQSFTDHLNALGRDGWELVSIFDTSNMQGQTRTVVAALKRLKP